MGTFACYKTLTAKQIKKMAAEAISGIEKWFTDHPKRKTCSAQLWYGQTVKVRKDHVKDDIDKAAKLVIEDDKTKVRGITAFLGR